MLYEIGSSEIPSWVGPLLVIVALGVCAMLVLPRIRRSRAETAHRTDGDIMKALSFYRILRAVTWIFLVIAAVAIIWQVHTRNELVERYRNGEYETIEGAVQHFIPMPVEGHSHESFDINGVNFEYSDYRVQPGYHQTRSHNGVISGDDQRLRIRYVWSASFGNIILYIEELP